MSQKLSKEAIYEKLLELMAVFLKLDISALKSGKEKIDWDTNIVDDVGVDSVEVLDLLGDVERRFDIQLDMQQAMEKRTVKELVDFIYDVNEGD